MLLKRLLTARRARVFWEWLAVGAVAAALVLGLVFSHATEQGDRLLYDQLLRSHGRTPSNRIVIVAIDNASLAALGAWPWPRARHAALIARLSRSGAAAIGYDVLFLEPDPSGGDARLAQALQASGRTILPALFVAPGDNGRAIRVVTPLASLTIAARGVGQVELNPDSDGVIRRASIAVAFDGACWPHMTHLVWRIAKSDASVPECVGLAAASRGVNGLLATPPTLIPFAGPPGRFATVSAVDVLNGDIPPAFFRNRMVLVGATAAGLGDRHLTAVSGRRGAMPGVEIQANLLDAAIQGKTIHSPPTLALALGSLAPIFVFLVALLLLEPAANMIVGAGLILAIFAICLVLFAFDIWAPPLAAAAGLLAAYPLWSWRRLVVASDYLRQEIARFPPAPVPERVSLLDDTLGRQVGALARAADILREQTQQMQDALQSLPDATVIVDQTGLIRLANQKAAALGASTEEALMGASLTGWLSSAVGVLEGRAVMASLEGGAQTVEITSHSGVDYEVGRAAISTPENKASGTIVRLTDVSAIRSANRQRDEVLQLLTHDLRAPLASILAVLDLGKRPTDDESRDRIGVYARRGLDLAESYVQLARAENYRFVPIPVDVSQAMLDAVDEIWPLADARSITMSADIPEDPAMVNGDRSLITRALINVLDNAVKYSPSGTSIHATLRCDEHEVLCAITDQGRGMSTTEASGLFEPFNRGEGWRSGVAGAGLGLAMVYTVTKRHGGEVSCQSQRGVGSTFTLSFPLLPTKTEIQLEA